MSTVRPGTSEDVSTILTINKQLLIRNQSELGGGFLVEEANAREIARYLKSGWVFIAEHEGRAAGYLTAALDFPEKFPTEWILPNAIFYCQIGVSAHARGAGTGRRLVEALIDAARNRGSSHIVCDIAELPSPNTASRAFHQSLGFLRSGSWTASNGEFGIFVKSISTRA